MGEAIILNSSNSGASMRTYNQSGTILSLTGAISPQNPLSGTVALNAGINRIILVSCDLLITDDYSYYYGGMSYKRKWYYISEKPVRSFDEEDFCWGFGCINEAALAAVEKAHTAGVVNPNHYRYIGESSNFALDISGSLSGGVLTLVLTAHTPLNGNNPYASSANSQNMNIALTKINVVGY